MREFSGLIRHSATSRHSYPGYAVAEFWGIKTIAKRLGVAPSTAMLWYERRGLLMFTRRRGPRFYWWTNDELINQWLVAQCVAERNLRAEKKRRGAVLTAFGDSA
jgi:hypothetical protein